MMLRGQLGIRLVRHGPRFLVPALIASLFPHSAQAQTEVRRGVLLNVVVEQPYTIRGSTAQALLTQMRTVSPGAGWTSFRSMAWWNYDPEERQSVRGVGSGRCRVRDFEVRFDITEIYPVWERPPNAPPGLVEAWESFEELIRQQREERRDALVDLGVEWRRRTRRTEDACNFLRNRVRAVVDDVSEEHDEAQREARDNGEFIRLRWPPAGYSDPRPPAFVPPAPPSRAAPTAPEAPSSPPAPSDDDRIQPAELCSDNSDDAIATFEDANLEMRVRTFLQVDAQEDLTCGLVSDLTRLNAASMGVESLVGIQNLTILTDLALNGNSIGDVGWLSGLTSLTSLSLRNNPFNDISALSGLTGLTALYLDGNSVTDLSPLSGLTRLTELSLYGNSVSDIGALSGRTRLTSLNLQDNSITALGALSGLTSLRNLYLRENSITDIDALSGLTSLANLDLNENSIRNIGALSGLTSLTALDLNRNSITEIGALSGLTNLTSLFLNGAAVSDISAVSGLTKLVSLHLVNNSISDISALNGLTSLMIPHLGDNSISDISALGGLTGLRDLDLAFNLVSDVTVMGGLTGLMTVFLSSNPNLTDIRPLLDNAGLGTGDTLYLESTRASCADVAALEAKGVRVVSSCRCTGPALTPAAHKLLGL